MTKDSIRTVAKILVPVFTILVVTMWTYYPDTKNQFVWDTNEYLNIHEFWISKLSVFHIMWMFSTFESMNWHPLTWLSWAIDYQVYGGLDPWGYHLSNNIIHALNSALVFVLILVVFGLNRRDSTGYPFRKDSPALIAAFLAALLFAVHPQHVESVAWVAERKDLLFQLFLLLSMLTYVKYVTCSENRKRRWFRLTLVMFVMALLSKPMAVTLPVVLLLIDVFPLRRAEFMPAIRQSITQLSISRLFREKVPFFLLSAFSVLITIYAQQGALSNTTFDLRLLNAFNSIILYLTKLLLPLNFVPFYPYFINADDTVTWTTFVPVLAVLGLTLACIFAWIKGQHAWLIAWLFYLVTLSPVLGLIQVGQQGAADRYAYFTTLPVYILLGAAILIALSKTKRSMNYLVWLVILPIIFLLAGKTRQQIQIWQNDKTFWSYTILHFPTNAFAHKNLGGIYYNIGNYEKAGFYFKKAGELNPRDIRPIAWLALSDLQMGQYEEALNLHLKLGSAAEANPKLKVNQYCLQYNIGWIFAHLNMFAESSELFNRIDPNSTLGDDAGTWLNWLETREESEDKTPANDKLPSFCDKIFQ